ncbi:MAG: SH3 domain-containing protein [Lachnospiraceae bacterium]|nr:SH3 domain-containing protein [Lachnospiraceae bacterium]
MKKIIKKSVVLLMAGAMVILPVTVSVQAKEVNNDTKEAVEYSTRATRNGTINANNVNLRSGPSMTSKILGQLNKNVKVKVTSTVTDIYARVWCYCEVLSGPNEGLKGYVAEQYID